MPDVRSGSTVSDAIWPGHRFTKTKPTGPWIPQTSVASMTAFAVCPQLHGFAYELGIGPRTERDATKIGSLVHVGHAYLYGAMLPQKPEWLVYPDPRTAIWTCGQDRPDLATEALRVFDAYTAHYNANTWRPLLVEHKFDVVMDIDGQKEKYTLRIDLLAEETLTGQLVLVDHKTLYSIGRNTGASYRTDREMLTALALCRANGYDVSRVIINAVTKEHPPQFGRFDVPLSQDAYARLGQDTIHWIRQMRRMKLEYPDATNRPRAYESCMRKYGICDLYPVCSEGVHRLAEYKYKWGPPRDPRLRLPMIGDGR